MSPLRSIRLGLLAAIVAMTIIPIGASVVLADTKSETFDGMTVGSPNGQAGWQAAGSAGSGCATYDHAIVDNTYGIASFGLKSLRMSNAVTSGCFSDQTFSASLVDEAGETSAQGGGFSGGTRQRHFEAQWDFASTVPGSEQAGLSVVASPDRGDGARMSWIQMADTPAGLAVNVYDYRDEHVTGGALGDPNGAAANDDFFFTTVASGLDRTIVHSIKVSMDFLEGPRNDVVRVWVDGTLRHVDTSWEDYFRYAEGNPTRTVDSILFRTGGTAAPATAGNGLLIDNLTLTSGPTTTAASTGSWELYPEQAVSSTATTTITTAYRADVRAPINSDGSSNFPKKRGVIPVQFDLSTSTRTVVSTTTTTGPVHFESILSDNPADNDYAFLSFTPTSALTFADLDELVANYVFTQGNCGGGSLRWSVQIDVGSDGDTSNDASIWVYYGDMPNFTDCSGAASQSGVNLIGSSDARFDASQLGGPTYGTYADMLALYGNLSVVRSSLVLDSGWFNKQDQVVTLTGASVDGNDWAPAPDGTATTVTSDTTTPFAKTCALPSAKIQWAKSDPTPDGGINEAESIQPKDSGVYYRIVDCKYMYNLDVSSLDSNAATRGGTYYVWVNINGVNVPAAAKFDLR